MSDDGISKKRTMHAKTNSCKDLFDYSNFTSKYNKNKNKVNECPTVA